MAAIAKSASVEALRNSIAWSWADGHLADPAKDISFTQCAAEIDFSDAFHALVQKESEAARLHPNRDQMYSLGSLQIVVRCGKKTRKADRGFALPFSNETRSYPFNPDRLGTHSTKKTAQEKGGGGVFLLCAGESRLTCGCTVLSGTTLGLARLEQQQQQQQQQQEETARTVLLPCGAFARFR